MTDRIELQRDLATANAVSLSARIKANLTRTTTIATANVPGAVGGFDISKWTVIKNADAALEGQSFAIIRARDGIRDDSSWAVNKSLAKRLPFWGAYAYFNPRFTTNEADGGWRQCEAFWELIAPSRINDGMNIPSVIDCEPSPNFTMPSPGRYLHELKIYVTTMAGHIHRQPIIYSNYSFLQQYLEVHVDKPNSSFEAEQDKQWLRDCPLWIARPTTATAPGLPTAWSKWAFWQYKLDVTTHPGLSVCDENYWPGTLAQLDAWCKSESAGLPVWGAVEPEPEPEPPVPPVGEVTRAEFYALVERVDAQGAALTELLAWARNVGLK